jgi:hypothetical protein
MNNKLLIGLALVAGIVGGVVGVFAVNQLTSSQLGGDFAGGITPSNLFSANVSANSVTPNLSNMYLNGGISVGGTAANNQIPVVYTATTVYPASAVTLGPIQATTSTTSTAVSFTATGFSVGDACEVAYNGNGTSTTPFGADAFITSVSGNAATATVTFWNGNSASLTLTATSTVTGVSSTLKTTCFHTGV